MNGHRPRIKSQAIPSGTRRLRPCAQGFLDSLREFLPPVVWKEAGQARRGSRRGPRWMTQPLVLTLLLMTWSCGDTQAERFEMAKGLTAACLHKRRGPGKTVPGFQKALAKIPTRVLRAVAAGIRRRLLARMDLAADGFIAFGCDGSSMECPRTVELETRLDPAQKKTEGTPQVWVTALVHLRTGLLWSWRLGKGFNRERAHLLSLLGTLPARALVVADPGFNGYGLARALSEAGVSYLIRMSAKDTLYVTKERPRADEQDGDVLLWPLEARRQKQPPLRARLLRVRAKTRKRDVWLLTNVYEPTRMTVAMASQYYRWRWESEGLFRTFKRTLSKVKLSSRTVRLVHREAEGALLATQLLLAQATRGIMAWPGRTAKCGTTKAKPAPPSGPSPSGPSPSGPSPSDDRGQRPQRCSARKALLVMRDVLQKRIGLRSKEFSNRLAEAFREDRPRQTSKITRVCAGRATAKAIAPPRIRVLSPHDKRLAELRLRTQA